MCPLSWQSGVAETSLSNARFFKFEYRLQETRNEKKKNQQKAFQLRSIFGWLWFSFMGFILFFFLCEYVILTLARKEESVASSTFGLRLFMCLCVLQGWEFYEEL